ncbi:MAG: uroporphyrinogen-III synthase, partial [Candidatus Latescibacteria bacterium]|nr:uroporphyrinogen-III synthase [Candidatus Latescibacterota bacterium]
GDVDIVTFTSSSTVHNFFAQTGVDSTHGRPKLASIGPQTSSAIRRYGAEPDAEARVYTTGGLADAIVETFGRK